MTRLIAVAALLCLFSSAAHAAPESLQRCSDGSYRQTCGQPEKRIQSHQKVRAGRPDGQGVVAHPAGCPRRLFCGCGVSVKAFGRPIRELYLASNYGDYFNAGLFGPGNAAWRPGHVVYILGGTQSDALVYDPNSGRRQTRIHHLDLSRYLIADLGSPKRRLAGL